MLARAGLLPTQALEIGTREAMREAVAAGLGIGVMFDNEHGHDSRLALVPLHGVEATHGVYAATLHESTGLPSVRAWLDHVRAGPVATRAAPASRRRR